jgi:hypothetical protein
MHSADADTAMTLSHPPSRCPACAVDPKSNIMEIAIGDVRLCSGVVMVGLVYLRTPL